MNSTIAPITIAGTYPVNHLGTHTDSHADEVLWGMWTRMFGEKTFPGVSKASWKFYSDGNAGGLSGTDALQNHQILLGGIGGKKIPWIFDDHENDERGRKKKSCAALRAAEFFGMTGDKAVAFVTDAVRKNDERGTSSADDLSAVMRSMYQHGEKQEEVIEFATNGLLALYLMMRDHAEDPRVKEFLANKKHMLRIAVILFAMEIIGVSEENRNAWKNRALIETVARYVSIREAQNGDDLKNADIRKVMRAGKEIGVWIVHSDDENAKKACFTKGADVVILRNTSGNVQIFSQNIPDGALDDVISTLRIEELRARGNYSHPSPDELRQEGELEGAEAWYRQRDGNTILNGSLSHPEKKPTKILFEYLVKAVLAALDDTRFAKEHQAECEKGVCAGKTCSFYELFLGRCRKIRYDAIAAKEILVPVATA